MQFEKSNKIMPFEVSYKLAEQIYSNNPNYQKETRLLNQICGVFFNRTEIHKETAKNSFTCYIEKQAFDAFVSFANRIYEKKQHEATGVIVGYYLHDANNPDATFIVGTHFLEASGSTSSVTCKISYEDANAHSAFYEAHKLLPLIWIHSHPGFGVFYSSTDSKTLRQCYFAPHQVGVVVDNLQKQVLGFKMYGNEQRQENIYIFDLDKSTSDKLCLVYTKSVINKTAKMANTPSIENYQKAPVQESVSEHKENNNGKAEEKNTIPFSSTEKAEAENDEKNSNNEDIQIPLELKEVSEPEDKNVSNTLTQKAAVKMMIKGMVGTSAIMLLLLLVSFFFINRNVQTQIARIDKLEASVIDLSETIRTVQETVEEDSQRPKEENKSVQPDNVASQSQGNMSAQNSVSKPANIQTKKKGNKQPAQGDLANQGEKPANIVDNQTEGENTTSEKPTQDNPSNVPSDTQKDNSETNIDTTDQQ